MLNTLSAWLCRVVFDKSMPRVSEDLKLTIDPMVAIWSGRVNADWGHPANWTSRPPTPDDAFRLADWPGQTK